MDAALTDRALVIGVGNEYRGDDAVGLLVARRIARLQRPGVQTLELSGEGAALMEVWRGFGRVWIVDATSSGSPPGTIHRFDAASQPIPSDFFHYSTHAFSVAEAIELARALGSLPARLVVFGIEGGHFEAAQGVTPPVRRAVDEVRKRIESELAEPASIAAGGGR